MELNYHVTFRNKSGQPSITSFSSKEKFDEFYAGKMEDGSGDLIKDAYPVILYEGESEATAERVWKKDLRSMLTDRKRLEDHLRVEFPGFSKIKENK